MANNEKRIYMKNRIYLDYAATTPVDDRVAKAMSAFYSETFGNASSVHSFGREAAKVVDAAREKVAKFLNAQFGEIIVTSGATEANNLAILGLLKKFKERRPGIRYHLITSAIEHSSVLETFEYIKKEDLADVTILPVNASGIISVESVSSAIRPTTVLISIMYANNDIGTIQPIREIGKLVKKVNEEREKAVMISKSDKAKTVSDFGPFEKLYFHADAVQAGNYLNMNVLQLHVDMLTISAHKLYGPKGVGALYLRSGTPLENILFGGDQELSLRPGTTNVAGIVGLAEACSILTDKFKEAEAVRLQDLRFKILDKLKTVIPNLKINGDLENRLPNNLNVTIPDCSGETILYLLDQEGIAVSTGSACASGGVEPSHVLLAIGKNKEEAKSSIRITMGRQTEQSDFEVIIQSLAKAVKSLI